MMKGIMLKGLMAAAVVAALAASAPAAQRVDDFNITLRGNNEWYDGGGTGWDGGAWFYYDQTEPAWWNTWFYDDPPDPLRRKEIYYDIQVTPLPEPGAIVEVGSVQIALNWSTLPYPQTGPLGPPPMPDHEVFIERGVIYAGTAQVPALVQLLEPADPFIIPYNPEWVSMDVYVEAWQQIPIEIEPGVIQWIGGPMRVEVTGRIWHECVPEPATLSLLALGGLGALLRRRK